MGSEPRKPDHTLFRIRKPTTVSTLSQPALQEAPVWHQQVRSSSQTVHTHRNRTAGFPHRQVYMLLQLLLPRRIRPTPGSFASSTDTHFKYLKSLRVVVLETSLYPIPVRRRMAGQRVAVSHPRLRALEEHP